MVQIKTLKNRKTGKKYSPRTHVKAVYDDNNNTLDSLLGVQNEKLSEIGSYASVFDILEVSETNRDKFIRFFKDVRIYGENVPEISLWNVRRSTERGYNISFVYYDSSVTGYYINYVSPSEENLIKINKSDGTIIELLVDWSVIEMESGFGDDKRLNLFSKKVVFKPLVNRDEFEEVVNLSNKNEVKLNGVFEFVSSKSFLLGKFLTSLKVDGLPKDIKISLWNVSRNVNGEWIIRMAYNDASLSSGYALVYRLQEEKSNIHTENTVYINSESYDVSWDMSVDWTVIQSGTTFSSSREDNVISTNTYVENPKIANPNFELFDFLESNKKYKKLSSFFQSIHIYGAYSKKLTPYNIIRNVDGKWVINFLDYDSDSTAYEVQISVDKEIDTIIHQLNSEAIIVLKVDWSVISDGGVLSLNKFEDKSKIRVASTVYNNTLINNELSGKKILLFGDSITALKRENHEGVVKTWAKLLEEKTGCVIYNVGIGGTRLSQRRQTTLTPSVSNDAYAALDIVNLIKAFVSNNFEYQDAANSWIKNNGSNGVDEQLNILKSININDLDYVFIAAGTNDAQWVKIGEDDSNEVNVLNGCINNIVKDLLSNNKKLKLRAFTPIVRYFNSASDIESWGDRFVGSNGITLAQFVKKHAEAWQRNHIPVADMYWSLGINESNFSNYFPETDSTHPNYDGLCLITNAVNRFINSFQHLSVHDKDTNISNEYFDVLDFNNAETYSRLCAMFFKRIRITGASSSLRFAVWNVSNGNNGTWSIKFVEYNEDVSATGGYVCTMSSDTEKALLRGSISSGGIMEVLVDWRVLDGRTGIGADNRYSSRVSLLCYEDWIE